MDLPVFDTNLISDEAAALALRGVIRPAPPLSPEDSLGRFLQMARHLPVTQLPVLQDGKFLGMVSQESAIAILAEPFPPSRDALMRRPLRDFLQAPAAVAHPNSTPLEAGLLCAAHGMAQIPVVDEAQNCFGIILYSDLIAPSLPRPKPAMAGGMATPFGVYLTDGTRQAGVGTGALIASGACMGLLLILTAAGAELAVSFAVRHKFLPAPLEIAAIHVLVFGLFVVLLRMTRLAGYHAAEHQTVHAIERDEPLIPEVVCRMPRPHPRCGTNLMAAGLIFGTLMEIFSAYPALGGSGAYLFPALITLFTWRRAGTFLQAHFTTRPASERELRSGIAAGEELLEKYYRSPPSRPKLFQRIWCMGLIQIFIGMITTVSIASYFLDPLLNRLMP